MKLLSVLFAFLFISQQLWSQKLMSKYFEFDSVIVKKINYMIEPAIDITCETFNRFYEESETMSDPRHATFKLNKKEVQSVIELLKSGQIYKSDDVSVDVRAKLFLYNKDGKVDTLCYGLNFKKCFIYKGSLIQSHDENLYVALKKYNLGKEEKRVVVF